MEMFRHYDVTPDDKIVLLSHIFQHFHEQIAATRRAQELLATITTTGDKSVVDHWRENAAILWAWTAILSHPFPRSRKKPAASRAKGRAPPVWRVKKNQG